MRESLVIIHASDDWLDNNLCGLDVQRLKDNICERVDLYLGSGRKVFYTPYVRDEISPPRYLGNDGSIELIRLDRQVIIPPMFMLKCQSILTKDTLIRNHLSSVEFGGVLHYACVSGTERYLKTMNANDIEVFNDIRPKDIALESRILSKSIDSIINGSITDLAIR